MEIFGVRRFRYVYRYKYSIGYIMNVDDFMIYCVYRLFGCVFVNATEGRTIRIYIFVHESIII